MANQRHCNDYIDDYEAPNCLRWFLFVNRLPAMMKALAEVNGVKPKLFAEFKGKKVRVIRLMYIVPGK